MKNQQMLYPSTAFFLSVLLSLIVLTGCSAYLPGQSQEEEAWQVDKNDILVLYTSHKEEVYGPIIKEFEERTGIWVDIHTGGTTEMLEAVRSEADTPACDVMFGGGVESYEAYQDCFAPYSSRYAQKLDPRFCSSSDRWTPFTELPIVFIYNNKLVNEEDAPRSWSEFLGDKWKGKIAFADPRKSGSSCTALATMLQISHLEEHVMLEQFINALDGHISSGSGEVLNEVGTGIRLVGITLEETARKEIAAGADISMVYPSEGTSAVPDGCALVKGAPHEENAKLFIDFTISDDVQNLIMDQFCRRTVRLDMERPQEEIGAIGTLDIIDFDLCWASKHQEELLNTWASLSD